MIAKEPRPGFSKTRLCPPCTPIEAARLAEAALADTLDAVAASPAKRRVLVLDGEPGNWLPGGFDVVPQAGGGLDARLEAAFAEVAGPALLVGMDTPQLTPALLAECSATLSAPGADAVLGLAPDGGYWAIGLRAPHDGLFQGVPMSTAWTGRSQLRRLRSRRLAVSLLPELRDVDTFEDAVEVAKRCPASHFATELDRVRGARYEPERGAAWAGGR